MVSEVRGKGLLNGVDLALDKATGTPFDPALGVTGRVVAKVFEKGVLVMPGAPGPIDGVNGDHVAISPSFTVTEEEVDRIVQVLGESIEETARELGG